MDLWRGCELIYFITFKSGALFTGTRWQFHNGEESPERLLPKWCLCSAGADSSDVQHTTSQTRCRERTTPQLISTCVSGGVILFSLCNDVDWQFSDGTATPMIITCRSNCVWFCGTIKRAFSIFFGLLTVIKKVWIHIILRGCNAFRGAQCGWYYQYCNYGKSMYVLFTWFNELPVLHHYPVYMTAIYSCHCQI